MCQTLSRAFKRDEVGMQSLRSRRELISDYAVGQDDRGIRVVENGSLIIVRIAIEKAIVEIEGGEIAREQRSCTWIKSRIVFQNEGNRCPTRDDRLVYVNVGHVTSDRSAMDSVAWREARCDIGISQLRSIERIYQFVLDSEMAEMSANGRSTVGGARQTDHKYRNSLHVSICAMYALTVGWRGRRCGGRTALPAGRKFYAPGPLIS